MKMFLSILSYLFISSTVGDMFLDISNEVAAAIRSGKAAEVIKHCSNTVDLKILNKENVYSKSQAELILKDFFQKNPLKSFSIIHQGESKSGDRFSIGSYETISGKKFRSYFLFKKEGDRLTIQQMRFETQDE